MKRILIAGVFVLATAAVSANAAESDSAFLTKAIKGDNSEIALGQLAQEKANNASVKSFGQVLVNDHTNAKQQAVAVAKDLKVPVPGAMLPEAKDEQAKLQNLSGSAFDKEFVDYMVKDHKKDVSDFRNEASNASQSEVAQLAKKTLPTLERHLSIAEQLKTQVE